MKKELAIFFSILIGSTLISTAYAKDHKMHRDKWPSHQKCEYQYSSCCYSDHKMMNCRCR